MTQNQKIDEANASGIASSRMIGTVLFAALFVCLACLIAAVLILSAKAGM